MAGLGQSTWNISAYKRSMNVSVSVLVATKISWQLLPGREREKNRVLVGTKENGQQERRAGRVEAPRA